MTQADRGRYLNAMAMLLAAFREQRSEQLLQAYWVGLSPALDADELDRAANRAIAELDRMPSVAQLRRFGKAQAGEAEAATTATIQHKYRCRLHQESPRQVQDDFNWWCDCCRLHGDRDPAKTARQLAEINQWAQEWRDGKRERWAEKPAKIVTGDLGRQWTAEYTPPEVAAFLGEDEWRP